MTLSLKPSETALVLIDFQNGILSLPLAPRSGQEVLANGAALARQCKAAGVYVVAIHVGFAPDYADKPSQPTDIPMLLPEGGTPPEWSTLKPEISDVAPDLVIMKRHWSAFHGTELDLQFRRRGIRTMLLGGIATNFGVESTARDGWQNNYGVVIAEDCCTSFNAELHEFSITRVLPRVSRISDSRRIVAAL